MFSSSETLTDLKFLCNLAPRENPWERLVSALIKRTPKVYLTGGGWGGVECTRCIMDYVGRP